MTKNSTKETIKEMAPVLYGLLLIVAAFVAALLFRRSAGILAMTPLALIICAAASFIPIDEKTKTVVFGVMTFALNTVETKEMKITLIFTGIITVATFVFSVAVKYIKKKKKSGYVTFSVTAVSALILSFIFVGNPIAAMAAQDDLDEYISKKYPHVENAALGDFDFSSIYYNFIDGTYSVDAVSSEYPAESRPISAESGYITDLFKESMSEKITTPYVLEMTKLLRESFPTDNFTVDCDGVALFPNDALLSSENGVLYDDIMYQITLGGVQTANAMEDKVAIYMEIIENSGIGYSKIVFKAGIDPWIIRSVTINGNYSKEGVYCIDYVSTGTSNRFNRYVKSRFKIPIK